jgi:hypothetical protein
MKRTFQFLVFLLWSLVSTSQVFNSKNLYASQHVDILKSSGPGFAEGFVSAYSPTAKNGSRSTNDLFSNAELRIYNSPPPNNRFADPVLIRINAGGGQIIFGSETWAADQYSSGGTQYSNSAAIAATTNDALYQSERWGNHSYAIPVPNGSYTVKLHFAEIFHTTTGKRIFNVNVENGQGTLSNYDIVQQAGAKTAKVEQFTNINITDGFVNIAFTNIVDNAKISAIEVISNAPAVNTAPTVASPVSDKSLAFNTTSLSVPLSSVFADNNGFASLTLSVSGNTNTTLVTNTALSGGNLNLTLAAGQTGTALIKVKATDAEGLFAEDEFSVTVLPYVNTAPTVSNIIPDQSANINAGTKAISLSGVFADDAGVAALTLSVSGNTNTALITSAAITGNTLNLTVAPGQTGTALIKVKATDAQGLFVEDEFSIQVIDNSTPATLIRINAGGGQIIFGSETWAADQYSSGGSTYSSSNAISSTTNDALYQSERWGNHSYAIPVPNGSYTVKLHFAEIFHTATGNRVFNVNIENGQGTLSNYDIVQQAGANTAKVEQFTNINVTDGFVNIAFTNIVDNAKISGIEVISNAPVANTPPIISSSITDKTLAFNTTSLSIPLAAVFADNNGFASLSLSISGNTNTSLVSAATITNGNLNLSFPAGQSGSSTIKVKATDAEGLFAEDEFIVTIQPYVNSSPTVVTPIADQTLSFNTSSFNIPLSAIFSDNNGFASLVLSISGNTNPTLVTGASVTGGILNLSFAQGQTGTSLIKVKATDAEGLFIEDEFSVTVQTQVNLGPTISSSIPDQNANINAGSKAVSLTGVFADDAGVAALVLSVSGNTNTALITSASITGNTLNLTIAPNQTGVALIKVKATDAQGLFVEDEFSIQVVDNTTPAILIRINAGGGQIIFGSETWAADQYSSGGSTYSNTAAIAATTNDALYQSERWGNHNYAIPVPNGSYTVKLHFAEIFHTTTGSRVFNVNVENGQGTLSNYDIVQQAGAKTAKVEQFTNINITDGFVNIAFTNIVDNAKISAIEVISNAPAVNTAPTVASPVSDKSLAFNTTSLSVPLSSVFADNNGFASLTLSVSGNTNTTLVTTTALAGGNLNLTLAAGQTGTALIKVKATDAEGLFVEDEFSVTVLPYVNTAPTVSNIIPDQSANINAGTKAVSLSGVFADDAGVAALTLSVSGNTNTALITSAAITGNTLNLTIAPGQTGTALIKVKATDAQGLFVEDEFSIQVIDNSTPATLIRINAGGGQIIFGSETWAADQYSSGGSTYSSSNAISSTTNDALYQSERWGTHSYGVPVPNGTYTVRLHFAEIFFSSTGQRVFNISIENGQGVSNNFDIIAKAGSGNKAYVEEYSGINVSDGVLNVNLTNITNNAKISGIEIISGGGSNQLPVANAGADQTITLPANSVNLNGSNSSDPGGSIVSYSWSKISGPAEFTINSPAAASTTVSGLVTGTYTFRLTVTDNQNATASDDVVITVNAGSTVVTNTVIPFLSSWKFSDNGTNYGTTWRQSGYNDQSWSAGNAQLGFGDGDETTIVSYGSSSSNKHITTYFRKSVTINNPSAYTNFSLGVKRDDGVVVYVNGNEVYRNNMPSGTISYSTLASSAAADDGNDIQTATLSSSVFADGTNVIAVEIHQNVATSTDLSFDLRLIANANGGGSSALITRNPYLQMASSNAITIRWKTDVATDSKVSIGTSVGNYTITQNNAASSTDHEVRVTGLSADTKYYYAIGTSSQILLSGADQFFTTAPAASVTRKMAFAAFGDCGRNENGFQSGTLNAYQNFVGSNPADILLLLGDNAYDFGTEAEYNNNFFNVYGNNILKNHVTFPSPGNHDYDFVSQQSRNHAYYNVFSAPSNGESGGVPSGTEAFYSYNWGNTHFISLDSYGEESDFTRIYDTTGAQITWLKNDLAANNRLWTVVYFHHPPYSMGSHSSDTDFDMTKIRQNLNRILERYGVDLVITGHSHDYERSYPMRNHFGTESSFDVGTHALYNSSGKYDGSSNSCVYLTSSSNPNKKGTIYIVAGSAGADGGVQNGYPHNAMPFSVDDGGMFYFTVENNRLDGKFIRRDGVIDDQFTIMKDAGKSVTINATPGANTTLTASWVGSYQWSNGATTKSIVVSPNTSTTYTVSDPSGCITDVYNVNVNANTRKVNGTTEAPEKEMKAGDWKVYPIPVKKGQQLTVAGDTKTPYTIQVIAKDGRTILTTTANGNYQLDTKNMTPGIYYIRIQNNTKPILKKIMVMD